MIRLDPLSVDDIPEVMRIERLPGYEEVVGRWTAEEHAAELASPDARYFGLREGAGLAGFVIFQKAREAAVRLRRIAVGQTDRGTGTTLLRAAVDWAFEAHAAEAVTLDVARINDRARHVYLREGFVEEGAAADGVHINMRLTRATWDAARPPPGRG